MKRDCKGCGAATEAEDLRRCQTPRCRPFGDAYCPKCIRQPGKGFYAPFYCYPCKPADTPPPKRKAKGNRGRKPTRKRADRNKRLVRLRKRLGLRQADMAELLGISPRQYQDWEYSAKAMNEQAAIVCGLVTAGCCLQELYEDWPEFEAFNGRLQAATQENCQHG